MTIQLCWALAESGLKSEAYSVTSEQNWHESQHATIIKVQQKPTTAGW